MRRGGCDVPVVAAAPLAFAVSSPALQRMEIKVWRRSARGIPEAGEPLEEDWIDGREAYKKTSTLQAR